MRVMLSSTPLVRLGGLVTYPLYLLHETVGGSIEGFVIKRHGPFWLAFACGALASLAAALVIVTLWEPIAKRSFARVFDRLRVLMARGQRSVAATDN